MQFLIFLTLFPDQLIRGQKIILKFFLFFPMKTFSNGYHSKLEFLRDRIIVE